MAQQIINIGTVPNDNTGDALRTALDKTNQNFTDLYTYQNTYTVNTAVLAANVATINSNLTNYQTTAGLAANVAKLAANSVAFVGNVSVYISAANVVSNAQLTANLANYLSISGVASNVAKVTANNTTYVGSMLSTDLVLGKFTNQVNSTVGFSVNAVFVANTTSLLANGFSVNTTGAYVTGNVLNLGSYTDSVNGYSYMTNSFKMNWGWVSANSSTGNAIFTSAYAANAYSVTATSNTVGNTYGVAVTAVNSTCAQIRTGNATSVNVMWIAIGR